MPRLDFPEIEIQITRGGDPQPITDLLQGEIDAIEVDAGVNLKQAGDPVTGNPHTTLNFTGATVTDNGSGQATIAVVSVAAGTADRIAKYGAGGTNLVNSTITDDGTTVTAAADAVISGGLTVNGAAGSHDVHIPNANIISGGEILNTFGISSVSAITGSALQTGGQTGPIWFAGAGSPEGVQNAAPGCLFSDVTNGNLYVKHTGSAATGWQLVTAT